MELQELQVPWVRVRAATVIVPSGRVSPWAQVTPTSPKPATFCGVVVSRLAPPAEPTTRAAEVGATLRLLEGVAEVSCTSRTWGLTGAVGTREGRTASAVYAAVRAVGRSTEPAPAVVPEPTTSSVT